MKNTRYLLVGITLVAICLLTYLMLWRLPEAITPYSPRDFQRTQILFEARKTNAQILGGVALLFGFYLSWRNLRLAEEGKITERFTRAVDQLGGDKIEQRVGSIYALERMATDSKRDHAHIIELVCTFLRYRERTQEESEPYKRPLGILEPRYIKHNKLMDKVTGWTPRVPEDVGAAAGMLRRNRLRFAALTG